MPKSALVVGAPCLCAPRRMAHFDAATPAWEAAKENAAPRKGGRDVEKLARAFGGGAAAAEAADAERARPRLRA